MRYLNTDNPSLEFLKTGHPVGQYGAHEAFKEVEYEVDESKIRLPITLVQTIDPLATDLVYRYDESSVYSKPADYNHKPFPTKWLAEDESYIKTAGYVAEDDINFKVTNYDDILKLDASKVDVGEYIWVAKKEQTWDVLRLSATDYKVTKITNSDSAGAIEIETRRATDFVKDDIIGVLGIGDTSKFYKVIKTSLNTITATTVGDVDDAEDVNGLTKLDSVRVNNLTDAPIKNYKR